MRILLCILLCLQAHSALCAEVNVALNKPYTLSDEPNYPYCKDDGDATDLTDGRKHDPAGTSLWTQKRAVGWALGEQLKTIDIDLQSLHNITGCSFQTAASAITQGTFPLSVMVFVSGDNKSFRYAGELINQSIDQHNYVVHTFRLSDLDAHGRYVRLLTIRGGFYVFCTEVEVFGSPSENPPSTVGMSEEATFDFARKRLPALRQYNSSLALLTQARTCVNSIRRDHPETAKLADEQLDSLFIELQNLSDPFDVDFRKGIPFTAFDQKICKVIGGVYESIGLAATKLEQTNTWEPRLPFDHNSNQPPYDQLKTLHGEWAETAFNLTNGTSVPQDYSISITGLPDDSFTLRQVIFVEAFGFRTRADALMPIEDVVTVAPGITTQIWLTVDTGKLSPGSHACEVVVQTEDSRTAAPIRLTVSKLRFPETSTLDINVFGYMHWPTAKSDPVGTATDMREHYVNNHIIVSSYLPIPRVNAAGDSIGPMDFTMLDAYMDKLPHARRWTMFMGFEWDYRMMYPKPDEPRREKVFKQWLHEVIEHMKERGLRYDQFNFLWVDEPSQQHIKEIVAPCTRALREVDPKAQVWIDITGDNTEESLSQYADIADLWCPSSEKATWDFWKDKEYWYYDSSSDKSKSPTAHYRHKLWQAFALGATGNAFWTYMDGSDPWNDYAGNPTYGVVYNTKNGKIASSKRWEAYRAGIEDYELCLLLKNAITKANEAGQGDEAVVLQADKKLNDYLSRLPELRDDHIWAEVAHIELVDLLEAVVNLL